MRHRSAALAVGALALIAIAIGGVVHTGGRDRIHRPAPRPIPISPVRGPAETAIDFLAGLTLERLVDPGAREAFLARNSAPASLAPLRRLFAAEAERIESAASSPHRFSRAAVFGYRMPRRTASAAEVYVWAASVGAEAGSPVAVGWRTIRVSLARVGSRWMVSSVEEAAGPTPQQPGAVFTAAAARFRGVHAAP